MLPLLGSLDLTCVLRGVWAEVCLPLPHLPGLPAQLAEVNPAALYCTPSGLTHPSPISFLFHTDVSSCLFFFFFFNQALTWTAVPETRSFLWGSAKMPF